MLLFFLTFSTLAAQLSVRRCFPPEGQSRGQSMQLGKCACSNLTSYKSVKAMLFVHISLERKEWIYLIMFSVLCKLTYQCV